MIVSSVLSPPVFVGASGLVSDTRRVERLGEDLTPLRLQVLDETCQPQARVDGVEFAVNWIMNTYLAYEVHLPPGFSEWGVGCKDESTLRFGETRVRSQSQACAPVVVEHNAPEWDLEGEVPLCKAYELSIYHNQTEPLLVVAPDYSTVLVPPNATVSWSSPRPNHSTPVHTSALLYPFQAGCSSTKLPLVYTPGCTPRPVEEVDVTPDPFRLELGDEPQNQVWVAACWALVYGVYLMGWAGHYYSRFPRFLVLTTALMLVLQVPLSQHTDFTLYVLGSGLAFCLPVLYVGVKVIGVVYRGPGVFTLPDKHQLYGMANVLLFFVLQSLVFVVMVAVKK